MRLAQGLLLVFMVFLGAKAEADNARFIFWLCGACDKTIEGLAGGQLDDGTGGAPDFKNNRPGYTFEVMLTQDSIVHDSWQTSAWQWCVGVEGALQITDITLEETVSCFRPDDPRCLGYPGFYETTELTGLPYGKGPQTQANHGALSGVLLGTQFGSLPGIGDYVIAKIRVSGQFSPKDGESVSGRIFFTARIGSGGGVVVPAVLYNGENVLETQGSPPLKLRDCTIVLRAVGSVDDFIRCDATNDGKLDLSDSIRTLEQLFNGTPPSLCRVATDCNGDGRTDISDAIYGLSYLFLGTPAPPAPFPECGRPEGTTREDCQGASTVCP